MGCEIPGCECEARLLRAQTDRGEAIFQLCDKHIDDYVDNRLLLDPSNRDGDHLFWMRELQMILKETH